MTTTRTAKTANRIADRNARLAAEAAARRADPANAAYYADLDAWWASTDVLVADMFDDFVIDPAELNTGTPTGFGNGTGTGRATTTLASDKQIAFLTKLVAERPAAAAARNLTPATIATLDKRTASKHIDTLTKLPIEAAAAPAGECRWTKRNNEWAVRVPRTLNVDAGATVTITKADGTHVEAILGTIIDSDATNIYYTAAKAAPAAATTTATVPDGYYAIDSTGTNDLVFYKVENGTGRWVGRTFVRMVVGGHADQNVRRDAIAGILDRIAIDPKAASLRYGREIGQCGRCGRHLTDEASRAAGIGPDCAKKGW